MLKEIPGYEGMYSINEEGVVYSIRNRINLRPAMRHNYLAISLSKKSKMRSFNIHRLVAEAFIPNPNNLSDVNHKNAIKTDNRVENLEWVSHLENMRHAKNMGLYRNGNTGRFGKENKTSKAVLQFDISGNFIKEYESVTQTAKILGFSPSHISLACAKGKVARGFIWKYRDDARQSCN